MFAERLRALRKERGLTQAELARHVSLSSSSIAMYESGKRMPDLESIQRLAAFFGVTTDYLLGRTPDRHGQAVADVFSGRGYVLETLVLNMLRKNQVIRDFVLYISQQNVTADDIEAMKDLLEARRLRRDREERKGDRP